MKYLVIKDVLEASMLKGTIIDTDKEVHWMTIKLDEKFYDSNPHAFKRMEPDARGI
jgi:hypothetical protein